MKRQSRQGTEGEKHSSSGYSGERNPLQASDRSESLMADAVTRDAQHHSVASAADGVSAPSPEESDQKIPAVTDRGQSNESNRSGGKTIFVSAIVSDPSIELPDFVKRNNTTLTFPEKLMILLTHIERNFEKSPRKDRAPIAWVQDGDVVFIRDKDKLAKEWLPLFFQQTKFSSFTRKLYRWGFRQYSSPGESSKSPQSMYFFNENFRRNDLSLLSRMKSVTAAGIRREEALADAARRASNEAVAVQHGGVDDDAVAQLLLGGSSSGFPHLSLPVNLQPHAALPNRIASTAPALSSLFDRPERVVSSLRDIPGVVQAHETSQLQEQLLLLSQLTSRPQLETLQHIRPEVSLEGRRGNISSTDVYTSALLAQQQLPSHPTALSSLLPRLVQPPAPDRGLMRQDALTRSLLQQQLLQQTPLTLGQGLTRTTESTHATIVDLLSQLQRQDSNSHRWHDPANPDSRHPF